MLLTFNNNVNIYLYLFYLIANNRRHFGITNNQNKNV